MPRSSRHGNSYRLCLRLVIGVLDRSTHLAARRARVACCVLAVGAALSACGFTAGASADWTRFGYDAGRTNDARSGLKAGQVAGLVRRTAQLPGTVDSSPIFLGDVDVLGQKRNLLVVTTTYGRTLGLNPVTGAALWAFTPSSYGSLAGSAQISTASPVADPDKRFVYASSPDGRIHKLKLSDGSEVRSGEWPAVITRDPSHEKIASALNLSGRHVLATMGGYLGDAPPYQGKVVAIDRSTGHIAHVFNAVCSKRHVIIDPSGCFGNRAAIWGRAGAVVDPVTHDIYATTGNGPFNGRSAWGDSVLELGPGLGLRRHYTPKDQAQLEATDADLGSTSPALLPAPNGGAQAKFLLQGGKDGKLRLLRLSSSLHGITGDAGRRLGGEVQVLRTPGADVTPGAGEMFTAPAVRHGNGSTRIFIATDDGTAAYRLMDGRLHVIWRKRAGGTSPVIAGSIVWVYDRDGGLRAYRVGDGHLVRKLPAPSGHWNSPIVAAGRVYLPTGDANDHATSGSLSIYHAG
jgi:outer membrane protein assembly factor BamB